MMTEKMILVAARTDLIPGGKNVLSPYCPKSYQREPLVSAILAGRRLR